ncbi:MAG: sulfatase [Pirellulales bacterium]
MKTLKIRHAMTPRFAALPLVAVVILVLLFVPPVAAQEQQPLNIVFVLADDLGWADLGCYGNDFIETPRLDGLAAQGMRFTDAYAAGAVCSPTRASLMTGMYPARLNITDFIPGHYRPFEQLTVPPIENQLSLDYVTLAEPLDEAGYATCYLGKWHLGGANHHPSRQGFHVAHVTSGQHFAPNWRSNPPLPGEREENEYLADALTDAAIGFIRDHREHPFLLYLSHYAVHIPLEAKQATVEKYREKAAGGEAPCHPTYAAMVEHVDQSVGRLLDALDELNLADNTLVIFFSDNGGLIQRYDGQGPIVSTNAPLRAEKGTLYEGGIRVPMIVRWPGRVEPGSESNVPVSSIDVLPTLLDAVDRELDMPQNVDGVSLLPLLTGQGELDRDALYWHYPHYHHMDPAGAIRRGEWKLIERFDDGALELYNLAEDIGEQQNLAGERPELAADLQDQLATWHNSVGARMPTRNVDSNPQRAAEWGRRN